MTKHGMSLIVVALLTAGARPFRAQEAPVVSGSAALSLRADSSPEPGQLQQRYSIRPDGQRGSASREWARRHRRSS